MDRRRRAMAWILLAVATVVAARLVGYTARGTEARITPDRQLVADTTCEPLIESPFGREVLPLTDWLPAPLPCMRFMSGTRPIDIDGDGKVELVAQRVGGGHAFVQIDEDSGIKVLTDVSLELSEFDLPEPSVEYASAELVSSAFMDVDDDRLPDLIISVAWFDLFHEPVAGRSFWTRNALPAPPPPYEADLSRNGVVDFADINELLIAWGPCPCEDNPSFRGGELHGRFTDRFTDTAPTR